MMKKIFEEMVPEVQGSQRKYERTLKFYKNLPSIDRVIPVEEEIDVPDDQVLPHEDVQRLIDDIDTIALAYCFCRHKNYLAPRRAPTPRWWRRVGHPMDWSPGRVPLRAPVPRSPGVPADSSPSSRRDRSLVGFWYRTLRR